MTTASWLLVRRHRSPTYYSLHGSIRYTPGISIGLHYDIRHRSYHSAPYSGHYIRKALPPLISHDLPADIFMALPCTVTRLWQDVLDSCRTFPDLTKSLVSVINLCISSATDDGSYADESDADGQSTDDEMRLSDLGKTIDLTPQQQLQYNERIFESMPHSKVLEILEVLSAQQLLWIRDINDRAREVVDENSKMLSMLCARRAESRLRRERNFLFSPNPDQDLITILSRLLCHRKLEDERKSYVVIARLAAEQWIPTFAAVCPEMSLCYSIGEIFDELVTLCFLLLLHHMKIRGSRCFSAIFFPDCGMEVRDLATRVMLNHQRLHVQVGQLCPTLAEMSYFSRDKLLQMEQSIARGRLRGCFGKPQGIPNYSLIPLHRRTASVLSSSAHSLRQDFVAGICACADIRDLLSDLEVS